MPDTRSDDPEEAVRTEVRRQAAGVLEGVAPEVDEVLVLDATSLLVAEYLAVRHEGAPDRCRSDFAAATRIVGEWFPARPLALDAALGDLHDGLDTAVTPRLAEALGVPLATKHADVSSDTVIRDPSTLGQCAAPPPRSKRSSTGSRCAP